MTISRKMLEIIRIECQNVTSSGQECYDDYGHDLLELIADVATLEATHLQQRIHIVPAISTKIDVLSEILLKRQSSDSEEQ